MKATLQRAQLAKLLRTLVRHRRRLATEGGTIGVQMAAGLDMAIAEVRVELRSRRLAARFLARQRYAPELRP